MATLVEQIFIEYYRTRCPHCRPQPEPTKEALVKVTRKPDGTILDLVIECDWARDKT